jgi:hypothetical protein
LLADWEDNRGEEWSTSPTMLGLLSHLVRWVSDRWAYAIVTVIAVSFMIARAFPILSTAFEIRKQNLETQKADCVKRASAEEVERYDAKIREITDGSQRRKTIEFAPVLAVILVVFLIVLHFLRK